jgi:hypothetical protein
VNTHIKNAESYLKNVSANETILEEISGLEGWDNKNIGKENYPSGEEKFVIPRYLFWNSDKVPAIMTVLF